MCGCCKKLLHPLVNKVAYGLSRQRDRASCGPAGDWIRAEKLICRSIAGVVYLLVGLVLVISSKSYCSHFLFDGYLTQAIAMWCIGWTAVGLGTFLIGTRYCQCVGNCCMHYVGLYGFAGLVIATLAFVVALYLSGESAMGFGVKFYSLSMLVGLVGGYFGPLLMKQKS